MLASGGANGKLGDEASGTANGMTSLGRGAQRLRQAAALLQRAESRFYEALCACGDCGDARNAEADLAQVSADARAGLDEVRQAGIRWRVRKA